MIEDLWYPPQLDVFLNHWFTSHEKARAVREESGGYLLPYRNHFFVCQKEAIVVLGLDPHDPDWARVGWDCARPTDEAACERLRAKRESQRRSAPP